MVANQPSDRGASKQRGCRHEPLGRRGKEGGSECLEMRRQPVNKGIVSMSIVLFMVFICGLSARRPNIGQRGEDERAGTDQNDSLCGAVVVAVGPWPVGDLKGGHDDGSRREGLKKLTDG